MRWRGLLQPAAHHLRARWGLARRATQRVGASSGSTKGPQGAQARQLLKSSCRFNATLGRASLFVTSVVDIGLFRFYLHLSELPYVFGSFLLKI